MKKSMRENYIPCGSLITSICKGENREKEELEIVPTSLDALS